VFCGRHVLAVDDRQIESTTTQQQQQQHNNNNNNKMEQKVFEQKVNSS